EVHRVRHALPLWRRLRRPRRPCELRIDQLEETVRRDFGDGLGSSTGFALVVRTPRGQQVPQTLPHASLFQFLPTHALEKGDRRSVCGGVDRPLPRISSRIANLKEAAGELLYCRVVENERGGKCRAHQDGESVAYLHRHEGVEPELLQGLVDRDAFRSTDTE